MIKVFALIPRRPDITVERFHDHWRHPHGDLALRITTMRGYVQSHRIDPPGGGLADAPYDGIAEVWFDDLATAAGMGEDPNYVNGCQADEPLFIDLSRLVFLMTEQQLLTAGPPVEQDADGVKLLVLEPTGTSMTLDADDQRSLGERLGVTRHVYCRPAEAAYAEELPPYGGVRELWWSDRQALESGRDGDPEAWQALAGSAAGALLADEHRVLWPAERVAGR